MDKQALSRPAIVAALALAAAIPLTMEAQAFPYGPQAFPYGHRTGTGYQFAAGADEGSTVDKANPTDDGSIIIECVGFDSGTMHSATDAGAALLHAVSMPQHSLGPSKCWHEEPKEGSMGGGGGGLITVF
jgi:hypothetical protein